MDQRRRWSRLLVLPTIAAWVLLAVGLGVAARAWRAGEPEPDGEPRLAGALSAAPSTAREPVTSTAATSGTSPASGGSDGTDPRPDIAQDIAERVAPPSSGGTEPVHATQVGTGAVARSSTTPAPAPTTTSGTAATGTTATGTAATGTTATSTSTTATSVTPPSRSGADHRGRILVVGDSLTVGSEDALQAALSADGSEVVIDGQVSRSTAGGIPVLEAMEPGPDDLVVVALGTNDPADPAAFAPEVHRTVDAAEGATVVWIDIDRPGRERLNDVLRAADATGELHLVWWSAVIGGHPDLRSRDRVHLDEEGYALRARVVAEAVSCVRTGCDPPPPARSPEPVPR